MFDPPIDNWTQADEDCYDCKHRLDLRDRIAHLEARVQAADALAAAMEGYFALDTGVLKCEEAWRAYRATEVQP